MEDGGCLGTTSPDWVFGSMLVAGVCFALAATVFVALITRPSVEDWSRRGVAAVVAAYLLQTGWFLYGEYVLDGGGEGVLRGLVKVLGWWLLASPFVVLLLRRRSLARRGLPMAGGWRRALTGARWLAGSVTTVSGAVTSVMIWAQVLSLRPC